MTRYVLASHFKVRGRLALAVGGVALALTLMLSLGAIVTGMESRMSAYIDRSGADVWVAQTGVRTMHMSASSIPASTVDQIRAIDGIETVTPILYVSSIVVVGRERISAYVIGLPETATSGVLWDVDGTAIPSSGGAVIDRGIAEAAGVIVGDSIGIFGRPFTITGLSGGTTTLVSSIVVIAMTDFALVRGSDQSVSYVLVRAHTGVPAAELARRIQTDVQGVTAQTTDEFAAQERDLVRDMSTDLVSIMNAIGFVIGLAVLALMSYTTVLGRRREYGLLKALGARNAQLYRGVFAQAIAGMLLGLMIGLVLTEGIAIIAPRFAGNLALEFAIRPVLTVAIAGFAIAALAALLPIRLIASIDPALVFRKAS